MSLYIHKTQIKVSNKKTSAMYMCVCVYINRIDKLLITLYPHRKWAFFFCVKIKILIFIYKSHFIYN